MPPDQKHIPIYTRTVKGRFRNFKTGVLLLAYATYFILPWLPWPRTGGAHQALLFDLVSRRLFLFDLVIYPQDMFLPVLVLLMVGALLLFTTGLIGLVWCGYFCFHTLWTDAFMLIEHWIQGERPARIRLAQQPWNVEKMFKVGGAHALMGLLSFWTAFTFATYFNTMPEFLARFLLGTASSTAYCAVLFLTLSTYLTCALLREQVCIFLCPYARLQSVMFDLDTLVPAYHASRGEGMIGRIVASRDMPTQEQRRAKGHGDCVDCGYCVQVCPTGVDIRDGLQSQCMSCGLCIDACNTIMDRLRWQRGLIRYDSARNLQQPTPGQPQLDLMRPKVLAYAGVLALMLGVLVYGVASRTEFEVSLAQVRQPLYVELSNGKIRNRYQLHLVNKTQHAERYLIKTQGLPQNTVDFGPTANPVAVPAGRDLKIPVTVGLDRLRAAKTKGFDFLITAQSDPGRQQVRPVSFDAPKEVPLGYAPKE